MDSTGPSTSPCARLVPRRRTREEEPLRVLCDFGVTYRLYMRPVRRNPAAPWRAILKVSWEEQNELRSCVFEIDFARERLVALGRKGNSLPADRLPAKWFCAWATRIPRGDSLYP